ncbi:MAG: hypothetical protein LBS26_02520 [Campylobacteraceae bacterium]|jgi:hypothetical protein|nr:hypothetical protein [Campylobacteraceae bacterium]
MNLSCHFKDIPKGYTKHYYAGNDRIASKIGGGGLIGLDMPCSEDWPNKMEHWQEHYNELWEHCFYNTAPPAKNKEVLLRSLYDYMSVQQPENHHYFYHSDHLGSSAWISNTQGQAMQHLQYLPFGEPRNVPPGEQQVGHENFIYNTNHIVPYSNDYFIPLRYAIYKY